MLNNIFNSTLGRLLQVLNFCSYSGFSKCSNVCAQMSLISCFYLLHSLSNSSSSVAEKLDNMHTKNKIWTRKFLRKMKNFFFVLFHFAFIFRMGENVFIYGKWWEWLETTYIHTRRVKWVREIIFLNFEFFFYNFSRYFLYSLFRFSIEHFFFLLQLKVFMIEIVHPECEINSL